MTIGTVKKKKISNPIEALSEISSAITSIEVIDEILKLIVIVTAKTMNSNICSLLLIDEATNLLEIKATQSINEKYNTKPCLKVGEGIAGKVASTHKPMVVANIQENQDYKNQNVAKECGLMSLLCVPLMVRGKCLGVLNCYTPEIHEFTKQEAQLLQTIANQAAMSIENTTLAISTQLMKQELEERKVIEKAKGCLTKQYGISEENAYNRIKKHSMDQRRSIYETAQLILEVNSIALS